MAEDLGPTDLLMAVSLQLSTVDWKRPWKSKGWVEFNLHLNRD